MNLNDDERRHLVLALIRLERSCGITRREIRSICEKTGAMDELRRVVPYWPEVKATAEVAGVD